MLLGNALEYLENQTMGDYPRILSRQAMKGPCWLHCPLSKQSCSLSGSLWYVQLMLVPGSRSIYFPAASLAPSPWRLTQWAKQNEGIQPVREQELCDSHVSEGILGGLQLPQRQETRAVRHRILSVRTSCSGRLPCVLPTEGSTWSGFFKLEMSS